MLLYSTTDAETDTGISEAERQYCTYRYVHIERTNSTTQTTLPVHVEQVQYRTRPYLSRSLARPLYNCTGRDNGMSTELICTKHGQFCERHGHGIRLLGLWAVNKKVRSVKQCLEPSRRQGGPHVASVTEQRDIAPYFI